MTDAPPVAPGLGVAGLRFSTWDVWSYVTDCPFETVLAPGFYSGANGLRPPLRVGARINVLAGDGEGGRVMADLRVVAAAVDGQAVAVKVEKGPEAVDEEEFERYRQHGDMLAAWMATEGKRLSQNRRRRARALFETQTDPGSAA